MLILYIGINIGDMNARKDFEPFYVSSTGIIHNSTCKFYRSIPDARNCEYCEGKNVNK